jgi:hypothetical protein
MCTHGLTHGYTRARTPRKAKLLRRPPIESGRDIWREINMSSRQDDVSDELRRDELRDGALRNNRRDGDAARLESESDLAYVYEDLSEDSVPIRHVVRGERV